MKLNSKKILFLIDGILGGGTERVVLTLTEEMARQGHEVTILSLRFTQPYYPIPKGVRYHVLRDSYHGPFYQQTELWRCVPALEREIERLFPQQKIDLVISNLPRTDRIVAASAQLRDAWFCLHTPLEAGELKLKKNCWKRWKKKRQFKKVYSGKNIITVSHGLQQDLRSLGVQPACLKTIYNPFDFQKIRAKAQEKCPFEGERFLLHVGRLHPQKRHDRLLEAFKLSNYPGKLVLLGEGTSQEKNQLQQEINKQELVGRVVFEGFSTNPYAVMRAAEALVLSSDSEGLGNVLVEALICGTQVASTNCPFGPGEILRGPLAQGLAELTAPALAAAINRVLTKPVPITEEMLAPFSLERSAEQYLALCTDV